tara:strand:- start:1 stop:603 length:603 start_codon:yes stop_codon:yes gene_type:complete
MPILVQVIDHAPHRACASLHANFELMFCPVGGFFELTEGMKKKVFKHSMQHFIGKAVVPVIRLASFIEKLPADLIYEVLKIDAENADVEIIEGTGKYLSKFKCVVGEFGGSTGPEEHNQRYVMTRQIKKHSPILQAAGFVPHPRHSKGMNQLWVNRALRAQFTQSKGNLCFSKEIYRHNGNKPLSDEELVRVIDGTYQAE